MAAAIRATTRSTNMNRMRALIYGVLTRLRSRKIALTLLFATAVFALIGSFAPFAFVRTLFSSWPFQATMGILAVALIADFGYRLLKLRSHYKAWSSFLLHTGLAAIILGGAINSIWAKEKRLELIEGQEFAIENSAATMKLEKVHAFYKPGRFHKGAAAEVILIEPKGARREIIHVNRTADTGGKTLLLGLHGFAPLLHIRDKAGKTLLRSFVSLRTDFTQKGTRKDAIYHRTLPLDGENAALKISFSPSHAGSLPTDPHLTLKRTDKEETEILRPGEQALLSGMTVTFEDFRYWAGFKVRRDPGLPLLFSGFLIAIIGYSLRLWRTTCS